jgi:amidophosphoribosyltransferase
MDEMQSPSDDAAQLDLDLTDQDSDLQDSDLNGDTLREECGVFGIFGHPDAAAITALG